MTIGRSCTVCGARTDGTGRCPTHRRRGARTRPCLTCARPTTGENYCPDHLAQMLEEQRSRQTWRAGYTDPLYRTNRPLALKRDQYRCVRCGRAKPLVRLEVDHVIALSAWAGRPGSPNALSNLETLCEDHHRAKTAGRG